MMPGISGIKACEAIRKSSNEPILFLTAKARGSDKLLGLMAGGDDYLPKPCSYGELLGRVKVEKDPQEPKRLCTVWGKGYRIG